MIAKVYVTLKPSVLDPQGKAIQHSVELLGFDNISDIRQGKYFELAMDNGVSDTDARTAAEKIAKDVLANPVIEDYKSGHRMIDGEPRFKRVVEVLRDMQRRGVIGRHAVGGAVAASLYYEPISTVDLDIFFLFEPPQTGLILSMEPIYSYVREHGYEFDKDFIYIDGWPVQFIESSHDPLWMDGLENASSIKVGDDEIKVIPPEHLAVMWAQAGRKKDLAKIDSFEEGGVMNAVTLRALLERFNRLELWRRMQERLSDEYRF